VSNVNIFSFVKFTKSSVHHPNLVFVQSAFFSGITPEWARGEHFGTIRADFHRLNAISVAQSKLKELENIGSRINMQTHAGSSSTRL